MTLVGASSTAQQDVTLGVYVNTPQGTSLVGRLSSKEGEYIFRYDANYMGDPISAFPKVDQEYRSRHLWPFFAIRIPPLNREDMRKEIAKLSLEENQVLELLGSIAKISVANPYEFRLG